MFKLARQILTNRMIVGGVSMLFQLFILLSFLIFLSDTARIFYLGFNFLSILMVIWLVRKEDNPSYKISWIILIYSIPLLGGIFYLLWGNTPLNRASLIKLEDIDRNKFKVDEISVDSEDLDGIFAKYKRICKYVDNTSNFKAFNNSGCDYLKTGEEFFSSLVNNLKKAEKFIFLEYFIIENGIMWDTLEEILIEKASLGVEVRVMYDDAGCLSTLPASYNKFLVSKGISCVKFNPFKPSLHTYLNNRDHRKICVIDGKIGYIGGINLADEYINKRERFGHWKDMAIVMEGNAVSSLSMMFLELWEFSSKEKEDNYDKYIIPQTNTLNGYIQPFSDSPLDNCNVGENVYMQILNSAEKYVYITTPYLILDNEMITSLVVACQSGVDVKIITPHIPDKQYVHPVTRSYYMQLINAGVDIYEYTPGFMHGKVILSDDKIGVVGTINMDFRSFYMHFECGALLYDCPVLDDVKKDIEQTLSVSQKITENDLKNTPKIKRFLFSVLRIFSPMM